jgi:Mrp family chromosome partitioning ATPase
LSCTTCGQTDWENIFLRLRNALRASEPGRTAKILLISSSGAGEGKSTIALNLAVAAARDGESVLLVDGDLRERTISRQLDAPSMRAWRRGRSGKDKPGLGEVLKDLSTFNATVLFSAKLNLAVLPAGCTEGIGSRVDQAELFRKVFSKAQQLFDLVIIDGADARTDSFVRSLAAVAEEIIIVVRAGRTRMGDLDLATAMLGDASARIRGTVLNEAKW